MSADLSRDEIGGLGPEQQARLLGLRAAKELLSGYRDKVEGSDMADLAEYVVTGLHPMQAYAGGPLFAPEPAAPEPDEMPF